MLISLFVMRRISPLTSLTVLLPALMLACSMAWATESSDDLPPPKIIPRDAPLLELHQVQTQGESTLPRERKTLAQIFKAQALFQKHQGLAPKAELKFRVYARQYASDLDRADLALVGEQGRTPIALNDQHLFVADSAWRKLDQDSVVRSRLAEGRITWRPDIRSPGVPDGERRLGDLRLQCRIAFASGLARTDSSWQRFLQSVFRPGYEQCEESAWSPSNFADAPIFSVTLIDGERSMRLNHRMLHGLFDDRGQDFDWGFLLRDRMFRLPMGDKSWSDETRVVFETMDSPALMPMKELQASRHRFAETAKTWKIGETHLDEIVAALGKGRRVKFEPGHQILRYWQAAPKEKASKDTSKKDNLESSAMPSLSTLMAAKAAIGAMPSAADMSQKSEQEIRAEVEKISAALPPSVAAAASATAAAAAKAAADAPAAPERGTELVLLFNEQGLLQRLGFTERR
ncbi:hypothetical protein [Roseateles sp.]|uniref:hypothetical protein n=1 Tax=Roseateles sp. TaxID=1971397 RepID=UPI003BA60245